MRNPANPLVLKLTLQSLLRRAHANRRLRVAARGNACNSCTSSRRRELRGEICLHFPGGLASLEKPLVWAHPEVSVCLNCGFARFIVPEAELKIIQENV